MAPDAFIREPAALVGSRREHHGDGVARAKFRLRSVRAAASAADQRDGYRPVACVSVVYNGAEAECARRHSTHLAEAFARTGFARLVLSLLRHGGSHADRLPAVTAEAAADRAPYLGGLGSNAEWPTAAGDPARAGAQARRLRPRAARRRASCVSPTRALPFPARSVGEIWVQSRLSRLRLLEPSRGNPRTVPRAHERSAERARSCAPAISGFFDEGELFITGRSRI